MAIVRDLLRKIYPAYDELVVFTMTMGIIALVIIDDAFRTLLLNGAYFLYVEMPTQEFAQGTWPGVKAIASVGVVSVLLLACLGASLYLPFTKRNLDAYIGLIVLAHVLLIGTSNFLLWDKQRDPVSAAIAVVSFLWFIGFAMRSRRRYSMDPIVTTTNQQATGRQAVIASISILALIAVTSAGFDIHWAHSYALASAYAVGLTRLLE